GAMSPLVRFPLLMTLAALVAACAPGSTTAPGGSASAPAVAPAAPKVLTLVGREGVIGDFPGVQGREGGAGGFVTDNLVIQNDRDVVVARLAQGLPSVEKGTWRVNPDGTMDVIWKIRPNVRWHDGTPFTVDDLMFTFTAF